MESVSKPKRVRRERSQEVLQFLRDYIALHGRSPSEREIMQGVGLSSTSNVDYYLNKLVDARQVVWDKKISRGIMLPVKKEPPKRGPSVPMLGSIITGPPIHIPGEGLSAYDGPRIDIPESFLPRGVSESDVFALRVVGDSMRDAMILEGDTVLIHKTQNIRNGEIVAAWLINEETTTLKRIRFDEAGFWLEPENPSSAFKPTHYRPGEVEIQGKLLGVLRLYN